MLLFMASAIVEGGFIMEVIVSGAQNISEPVNLNQKKILKTDSIEPGFTFMTGEYMGAEIPVKEEIILGKNPEKCNIVLSDKSISKIHCTIEYENTTGGYLVKDFSINRTYINEKERIPKNVEFIVKPGTVISLGNEQIKFKLK